MLEKPFVEIFTMSDEHYIYDVNTNTISKISADLYNLLNSGLKKCSTGVADEIRELRSHGLLEENPLQTIIHPATKFLTSYFEHCSTITLQMTQMCNFKCRYCGFASATEMERSHNNELMDWDTAKASLDFLHDHSKDESNITIGFYGGEPLLNYNTILKCVKYAEDIFADKNRLYLITTNGSIINNDIVKMFNDYNFSVVVSLDGPQVLNDKNRRFLKNGEGTFGKVFNNINVLKASLESPSTKLEINCVIDPEEDMGKYLDFFNNNSLFNGVAVNYSLLDSSHLKYNAIPDKRFIVEDKKETTRKYIRILLEENSEDLESTKDSIIKLYKSFQPTKRLPTKGCPAGVCIPGYVKLYIKTNGDILPCEKVSEISECMRLGNVFDGFDIQKVKSFINIGALTSEDCRRCSAIRHCSICPRDIDGIDEFDVSYKKYLCRFSRKNFHNSLLRYVSLERCGILDAVVNKFEDMG